MIDRDNVMLDIDCSQRLILTREDVTIATIPGAVVIVNVSDSDAQEFGSEETRHAKVYVTLNDQRRFHIGRNDWLVTDEETFVVTEHPIRIGTYAVLETVVKTAVRTVR